MGQEEKTRYSEEELKEFEGLINEKLEKAHKELDFIKETLNRSNDSGTDSTAGTLKVLEDGADTAEKENLSQLAARQQKFILSKFEYRSHARNAQIMLVNRQLTRTTYGRHKLAIDTR